MRFLPAVRAAPARLMCCSCTGSAGTRSRHGATGRMTPPRGLIGWHRNSPNSGVWSMGYAASPSKRFRSIRQVWAKMRGGDARDTGQTMPLPRRGRQVLDRLVQQGVGQRPLMFVCHSLGGLVTKQLLRLAAESREPRERAVAESCRAVLFLATPHTGAELASQVTAFRRIFGSTVTLEDLREHDAHLEDLLNSYVSLAESFGIQTATYYETRDLFGFRIVSETSARPGVGKPPVPLDENHLSIAKPRERNAQVCEGARDLLRTFVLGGDVYSPPDGESPGARVGKGGFKPNLTAPAAVQEVIVRVDATSSTSATPVVEPPRQMPPAADRFFGRKEERRRLVERLREGRDSAVVGPAGMGKTALAASALEEVVGPRAERLGDGPFPNGVVFLDLYRFRAQVDAVWATLANSLAGVRFLDDRPSRERAVEACRGRSVLIVIEGAEEANGQDGRVALTELLGVLAPENRRLVLTRELTQAVPAERILLGDSLRPDEAAGLFDSLTGGTVTGGARERTLELMEGHPLALTWAAGLLARGDEDPQRLVDEWRAEGLPALSDPTKAQHSLGWLFERSVRGLDESAQRALAAAGLLARAPFPLQVIEVTGSGRDDLIQLVQRGLLRRALGDRVAEVEQRGSPASTTQGTPRAGLGRPSYDDSYEFTHVLSYEFARQRMDSDAALPGSLAGWLHDHLSSLLGPGAVEDPLPRLPVPLQHTTALLRRDHDQQLWKPLAAFVLFTGCERLVNIGRVDLVRAALLAVSGWLDGFPESAAKEPRWQQTRSACFAKLGDLAVAEGNLPEARRLFGEARGIMQRLAESDPGNATWQRDLSVSLNKLGELAVAEGNLPEAQRLFGEARGIAQRLAESDPGNATWQRDLSVDLNKLGELAVAEGNLPEAQRLFGEARGIRQRLAESDPGNATWQRDLSVSLAKLGAVNIQQEQWAAALPLVEQSLALDEHVAALAPTNVTIQRDLEVSRRLVAEVRARLE